MCINIFDVKYAFKGSKHTPCAVAVQVQRCAINYATTTEFLQIKRHLRSVNVCVDVPNNYAHPKK